MLTVIFAKVSNVAFGPLVIKIISPIMYIKILVFTFPRVFGSTDFFFQKHLSDSNTSPWISLLEMKFGRSFEHTWKPLTLETLSFV